VTELANAPRIADAAVAEWQTCLPAGRRTGLKLV